MKNTAMDKTVFKAIRTGTFGVTQGELAELLGCSVSAVRQWEQGTRSISGPVRILMRICEVNPALIEDLRHQAGQRDSVDVIE